jgi:hypothetical protein
MHHARMLPEGWDCFAGAAFDGQRAAYEPEGEWHKLVEPLAEKVRIMLMELYSVSVSANIVVVVLEFCCCVTQKHCYYRAEGDIFCKAELQLFYVVVIF